MTVEQWDRTIDVNLRGTWLCMQAAARHMLQREGGRTLLIGSISASQSEDADVAHS